MKILTRIITLSGLFFLLIPADTTIARASTVPPDSLEFRPEAERIFVRGMNLFQTGRYDSAAGLFMRCIRDFPRHHRITGAYIMGAKAYYRMGNDRESVRLAKNLIDLFPESSYIDDAHYTLGLSYRRDQRYEDSAVEFVLAWETSRDPVLIRRSEQLLDVLVTDHLNSAQVRLVREEATQEYSRTMLTVRLAERLYREGDIPSAIEYLRPLLDYPPGERFVNEGLTLLDRIEKGGVVKVGVLLPLMLRYPQPSMRELGIEILNGQRLAVEEYNQTSFPKISLEERDTERDPGTAARMVSELSLDEKIVAIVGPIFSNEAFATAGIANANGIPLITPTATSNGIASIGRFVFQLNPDYATRGRTTARFAYDSLGARTFAVLAPVGGSEASRAMADAFIQEVENLGADLVDSQWYEAGSTDLRYHLMTMRQTALDRQREIVVDFSLRPSYEQMKKMISWGVPPLMLDTLAEQEDTISVVDLFGERGKEIADSLGIITTILPIKYDSLDIPVTNIDAIFLPITSPEEIGIVASQLQYFNYQTRRLGTGDWHDIAELDQNRRYTNGVLFLHDTYIDEQSDAYRVFSSKYKKAFGRAPSVNSLLGYDAMRLLLEVIRQGGSSRESIASTLSRVEFFPGIHSDVSLVDSRVNSILSVFEYRDRTLRRIGEYAIPSPEADTMPSEPDDSIPR